jgi:NAD-dependent SIR2 family protein deacetylase
MVINIIRNHGSMPSYTCPECALVIELRKKQALVAMECFRCNNSFEPHLHPASILLAPATLYGQGKEQLSGDDAIGTLLISVWTVLPLLSLIGFLAFFFFILWIFS